MLNTLKSRPVLANFISLAAIQGTNLLVPLLTFPYLARVLGFEGVGILATAAATCAIFGIFIDWGFNLTATRAVSTRRNDLREVSCIFSAVTIAKLGLIALSLIVFAGLWLAMPLVSQHLMVYLFSFTFVACQALVPTWLFQGLERMGSLAIFNAIGKLIAMGLLLLLVNQTDDYVLVPLIYTVVTLATIAVAMYQLRSKFGIRFSRPQKIKVIAMLNDGRSIFTATIAGFVYSQGPVLILNAFTDLATVGRYSIAQKISGAVVSIFQSVSQAYFPHLSRLWLAAPDRFTALVRRYLVATQLMSSVLLGSLFFFADYIFYLLTGTNDAQGIEAMRYWLVITQLTVLSVTLNPVLVSIGGDRNMARMYVLCGGVFLFYSFILTWLFKLEGMLISMIIVEATIAFTSLALFMSNSRKISSCS